MGPGRDGESDVTNADNGFHSPPAPAPAPANFQLHCNQFSNHISWWAWWPQSHLMPVLWIFLGRGSYCWCNFFRYLRECENVVWRTRQHQHLEVEYIQGFENRECPTGLQVMQSFCNLPGESKKKGWLLRGWIWDHWLAANRLQVGNYGLHIVEYIWTFTCEML